MCYIFVERGVSRIMKGRMGTEITRVPPGFQHPGDDEGNPIPGAHYEPLYNAGEAQCTCYQLYENVTEGSPISPVFDSETALCSWLRERGCSEAYISMLVKWAMRRRSSCHSSSLVSMVANRASRAPCALSVKRCYAALAARGFLTPLISKTPESRGAPP
jgi:hypothetical protein